MKPIKTISALLLLAALSFPCRGEYAPMPKVVISMQKTAFKGKSPEEIARFLAHPDESTQKAAAAALADTPATAMPLIEKLLTDTNPWIRAGAVDVMTTMTRTALLKEVEKLKGVTDRQEKERIRDEIKNTVTPAKAFACRMLSKKLSDEMSPVVLYSICELFGWKGRDSFPAEVVTPFVKRAAQTQNPTTFKEATSALNGNKGLTSAKAEAATAIISRAKDHLEEEIWWAIVVLSRIKEKPEARQAVPAIAAHLRNQVNSTNPPFRGKLWNPLVHYELEVLDAQWDVDVERTPNVVPALCRAVVRSPYTWGGRQEDFNIREVAKAIVGRCTSVSAPVIKACADEEKRWLDSISDKELRKVAYTLSKSQYDPEKARKICMDSIQFLNDLANKLVKAPELSAQNKKTERNRK